VVKMNGKLIFFRSKNLRHCDQNRSRSNIHQILQLFFLYFTTQRNAFAQWHAIRNSCSSSSARFPSTQQLLNMRNKFVFQILSYQQNKSFLII